MLMGKLFSFYNCKARCLIFPFSEQGYFLPNNGPNHTKQLCPGQHHGALLTTSKRPSSSCTPGNEPAATSSSLPSPRQFQLCGTRQVCTAWRVCHISVTGEVLQHDHGLPGAAPSPAQAGPWAAAAASLTGSCQLFQHFHSKANQDKTARRKAILQPEHPILSL